MSPAILSEVTGESHNWWHFFMCELIGMMAVSLQGPALLSVSPNYCMHEEEDRAWEDC